MPRALHPATGRTRHRTRLLGAAVLLAPAAVLASAAVSSTSAAAPGGSEPERVTPAQYRAVDLGTTGRRLDRVLPADYRVEGNPGCRTRTYRGWDRDHFRAVFLLEDHRVTEKTTTARNESIVYFCDGDRHVLRAGH